MAGSGKDTGTFMERTRAISKQDNRDWVELQGILVLVQMTLSNNNYLIILVTMCTLWHKHSGPIQNGRRGRREKRQKKRQKEGDREREGQERTEPWMRRWCWKQCWRQDWKHC